jgi:plasmid stabilization system protein ParE
VTLRVRILPRAKTDFLSIFSYIEERSPDGASRWRLAFESGVERARNNPQLFPLAPEDVITSSALRQILFKTQQGLPYRAVFTVLGDELLIVRIRGAGQPPLQADEMAIE